MRAPSTPLRLALVFLGLVLLPSLMLAWFTLRAVDAESRSRSARLADGYQRFAEFAARTIHHELAEEESRWDALLPRRAGATVADARLVQDGFARRMWVLGADGSVADTGGASAVSLPHAAFPNASHAARWDSAVAVIDSLEFAAGDLAAASRAYAALAEAIASPRLRAVALAAVARTALAAGDASSALAAARRLRHEHPLVFDLDAEPLDLVALWSEARALDALGDSIVAAGVWADLGDAVIARSPELTATQRQFYRDRVLAALTRPRAARVAGAPHAALDARRSAIASAELKAAGDAALARKLERRLLRARLGGQTATQRVHYLSDVVDGRPFLIVFRLLPAPGAESQPAAAVGAIAGLVVDLPRLSAAVLPRFLGELEPSRWAVVDDAGRFAIGAVPDSGISVVRHNLEEPFEFWSVAVAGLPPRTVGTVDARTRSWLAAVAVLLLTILAGAALLVRGMRRQARLANLKTSFVSNVSHELRTPLASIRMYAEMLEMGGARLDAAERQRQIAVIRAESGRLERLIDAVLDFASLSRGTRQFRFEYEEIGAVVASVAESFRAQAQAQGFTYHVEIEPDLPEARVDTDAIRQVLLNLLANAVKYSDTERWIAVRAYRRGDRVALEVEDHGIGIDVADQKRIFEDFYRVDQRLSTPRQGVGLGLTLARRIVEAHGGAVEVRSSRGQGARFTVWLPCERPLPASTGPGTVAQEAGS